jgi:hypothetical protein
MNLHRVEGKNDWDSKSCDELNVFQKIAIQTNGFITPGN